MGKGKRKTTSSPAFIPESNTTVNNKIFHSAITDELSKMPAIDSPENNLTPKEYRKKLGENSTHLANSSGEIRLTRDVKSYSHNYAIEKFRELVNKYEKENKINVAAWSKEEALFALLSHIEKNNCLYFLPDDSQQFWSFKFKIPDILRIYLYKVFYPRVFECDLELLPPNGKKADLKGDFVSIHFENIFHEVEEMSNIIMYDAIIIAIQKMCEKYIACDNRIKIHVDKSDEVIEEDIRNSLSCEKEGQSVDYRKLLYSYFISSSVFLANCRKHASYIRDGEDKEKKLSKILTTNFTYKSTKGRTTTLIISKINNFYYMDILKKEPPFTKLLNIYHINTKSRLYDLMLLKNNRDFFPYMLDGILTKHHINSMIINNGEILENDAKKSGFNLSSIINNPNCVIQNINLRDYETINFLITRTAKTIEQYYLKQDKYEDATANELCEIIDRLNKEQYGNEMCKKVEIKSYNYIDNFDYDEIMSYLHPTDDL